MPLYCETSFAMEAKIASNCEELQFTKLKCEYVLTEEICSGLQLK